MSMERRNPGREAVYRPRADEEGAVGKYGRRGVAVATLAMASLAHAGTAEAAEIRVADVQVGDRRITTLGAFGRDAFDDQFAIYQDGLKVIFSAYFGEDTFQEDAQLPQGCKQSRIGGASGRQVDCNLEQVLASEAGKDVTALSLRGFSGNDTLTAHGDNTQPAVIPVVIHGGTGNDTIQGGSAEIDLLFGEEGNDGFTEGPGADLMDAGPGDDTFFSAYVDEGDVLEGGEGADTATFARGGAPFTVTLNGAADDGVEGERDQVLVENLQVQGSNATLVGDDGPNVLAVSSGGGEGGLKNRFAGLGGNDRIFGGRGTDEISGGEGDDEMRGSDDNDVLDGGPGKDDILGDWRGSRSGEAPGNDEIVSRDGVAEAVGCGAGGDTVVADAEDIVDADCEVVNRPPGPTPTPGPAPTPSPTPTPTPQAKTPVGSKGVGMARPKRDKKPPYAFGLRGTVDAPRGKCTNGKIDLQLFKGKKSVRKTTAAVRPDCTWRKNIALGKKRGIYRLTARFTGGTFVAAQSKAQTVTLRAG